MTQLKSLLFMCVVILGIHSIQAEDIQECAGKFAVEMQENAQAISENEQLACPIMERYGKCLIKAAGTSENMIKEMLRQAMTSSKLECNLDFLDSDGGVGGDVGGGAGGDDTHTHTDSDDAMIQEKCQGPYIKAAAQIKSSDELCPLLKSFGRCAKKYYTKTITEEDMDEFQKLVNKVLEDAKAQCTVDVRAVLAEGGNSAVSTVSTSFWTKFALSTFSVCALRWAF